jgi:hypothetical protein
LVEWCKCGCLLMGCRDMGYKSYKLRSREDLSNPFLAMYFGAAYVCWLTTYNGRYQSAHSLTSSSICSFFGSYEFLSHICFVVLLLHCVTNPVYYMILIELLLFHGSEI